MATAGSSIGNVRNITYSDSVLVSPIRPTTAATSNVLYYDPIGKEVTYGNPTTYIGSAASPQTIYNADLTQPFEEGVYRYVFYCGIDAASVGLSGATITITGLSDTYSINAYINQLPVFQSVCSVGLTPLNPIDYADSTTANIHLTFEDTTPGNVYFKVIVELQVESQ